jgi:restriction system protein
MVLLPPVNDRENQAKTRIAESVFLDSNEYHTFNNVPLQIGFRTAQIDHVIVSRFGIFVIGMRNKKGWIYGSRTDRYWTQMISSRKYRFANPLRRNFILTAGLAKILNLNPDKLYPAVVFWGNCDFRTIMPRNVLNNSLSGFIHSQKRTILTDSEVENACLLLAGLKAAAVKTSLNRTKMLSKWFGKN